MQRITASERGGADEDHKTDRDKRPWTEGQARGLGY